MPCLGPEIVNPTQAQKYRQKTAQCLMMTRKKLGLEVTRELAELAAYEYCGTDVTPELCGLIRSMSSESLESVVYNYKDRESRMIADWWDEHQELDRKRHAEEKEALVKKALAKLTTEEKIALELQH